MIAVPRSLPVLLDALQALEAVARGLRPGAQARLGEIARRAADALRAVAGPGDAVAAPSIRALVDACADGALQTLDAVAAAAACTGDSSDPRTLGRFWRALRGLGPCLEALYPLAGVLAPVDRHFRDPADPGPAVFVPGPADAGGVSGVMQYGDDRGGFWLYVPERAPAGRPLPLVMALHGGGGDGRQFLWRWLRTARSRQLIVVAPTAIGPTWAITGPDPDSPNLAEIVAFVRDGWPVRDDRLLLTGMSDGGTFCYTSGLEPASPFTHLAPVCASFHPMLAEMADPQRLRGLPVHVVHGALDWMFPAPIGRAAARALARAGADVRYREIDDLAHAYPGEANAGIVDWLLSAPSGAGAGPDAASGGPVPGAAGAG